MKIGVIIRTVINNMTFDASTKDPVQMAVRDILTSFVAATAQAKSRSNKSRSTSRYQTQKGNQELYQGKKPSFDRNAFRQVVALVAIGNGESEISKATGLTRQTVLGIKADQHRAEITLTKWGR